jgi:hypothetical protein
LSSAAEAELGSLSLDGKAACPIRTMLEERGHPQPPTPLQTDNSTAAGISNATVKQKQSKAIDMHFYWVRDRVRQKQFHVYSIVEARVSKSCGLFTKHHPASHHEAIRSTYLYSPTKRNRNFFEALQDTDDIDPGVPSAASATVPLSAGEGVLIPGNPETYVTRIYV